MEFVHNKNQIAVYTPDYLVVAEVTFPEIDTGTVMLITHMWTLCCRGRALQVNSWRNWYLNSVKAGKRLFSPALTQ